MHNYTFNDTKKWLKKNYPIPAKAKIYRVDKKTLFKAHQHATDGDCILSTDHRKVWIRIAKHLSDQQAIDALLHEWAHALRELSPIPRENFHDSLYWQIHGVVYAGFYGAD